MVGEFFSNDNSGNRVPAVVEASDPVPASGITLGIAVANTEYTQTLIGGQMYIITYVATAGKVMLASSTDVTGTAANVEWIFMANVNYIFRMPTGKTILHFEANEGSGTINAYVRKLA